MSDSYFSTPDGVRFTPNDGARGPWDPHACHAGPPTALMVRAMEALAPHHQMARITVELLRPIPMAGFRVQAEVRRPGRSITTTESEIFDDDRVYARAFGLHLRELDHLDCSTVDVAAPRFAESVPGPFPITETRHGLPAFPGSLEARYDPSGSIGTGGPTTMWMRTIPILPDEEPSGFQRLCPLGDSGNGISYNDYLDEVLFVNPDLTIALHRPPRGEWLCSQVVSHWQPNGVGMSDAAFFDVDGPVGRGVQTLLLDPAG